MRLQPAEAEIDLGVPTKSEAHATVAAFSVVSVKGVAKGRGGMANIEFAISPWKARHVRQTVGDPFNGDTDLDGAEKLSQ